MQVFVIGCNGYIGKSAVEAFRANNINVKAVSSHPTFDMLYLDLSMPNNFTYEQIKAGDAVLVTAAISSPDVCRNRHEFANEINVIGTGCFVERCLKQDAMVVFLSSDTVYGPGDMERDEAAICHPVGEYAFMKREVECRFADHPAFKILRLSYVFSRQDKFTGYLTACARDHKVAEIFHPMLRRAVYLDDFLDLLKLLCTFWSEIPDRVINVCGPELLSRVDMANIYRDVVSPNLQIKVIEPPLDFFVARPQVINMSDIVFKRILGRSSRNLHEAMIQEFIQKDLSL